MIDEEKKHETKYGVIRLVIGKGKKQNRKNEWDLRKKKYWETLKLRIKRR